MHPILFEIFGLKIASYGACMVLGGAAAWLLARALAGKNGTYSETTALAFLICVCGAFTGAFLLRPVTRIPELFIYRERFTGVPIGVILGYLFGEIVFYGGLIGGLLSLIIFCRRYKLPVLPLTDLFAPAAALAHAIGRIGCFLGGCCYGVPADASHPLAVRFPPYNAGGAPPGIPVLPTQLIEAACLLCIAVILTLLYGKTAGRGYGICIYGILYGILRFVLEFFRGDLIRGIYGPFSTSQYISVAIVCLCIPLLTFLIRKNRMSELSQ